MRVSVGLCVCPCESCQVSECERRSGSPAPLPRPLRQRWPSSSRLLPPERSPFCSTSSFSSSSFPRFSFFLSFISTFSLPFSPRFASLSVLPRPFKAVCPRSVRGVSSMDALKGRRWKLAGLKAEGKRTRGSHFYSFTVASH